MATQPTNPPPGTTKPEPPPAPPGREGATEKQHEELVRLTVKNAELEVLVRTIRDAINIQLDGGDDEPKQQKA
jgi:hypothetical protein